MKYSHDTISPLLQASDVVCWQEHLRLLHQRLRPYFARPEPFQRALRFFQALLSEVPRKNGGSYTALVKESIVADVFLLISGRTRARATLVDAAGENWPDHSLAF